ncbi:MAG: hypothetical protein K0Q89_11 [Thermomicrobiales bacterium]|jgi:hypothetical protein|nr:hypothetical protein [Thermomicrobiales bacterium]
MATEPPFNRCERHPDCLFQGGCECKRKAMRERATEPPFNSATVPCQDCLGLGRCWDRMGLTVSVCAACNGSGTDEEEGGE